MHSRKLYRNLILLFIFIFFSININVYSMYHDRIPVFYHEKYDIDWDGIKHRLEEIKREYLSCESCLALDPCFEDLDFISRFSFYRKKELFSKIQTLFAKSKESFFYNIEFDDSVLMHFLLEAHSPDYISILLDSENVAEIFATPVFAKLNNSDIDTFFIEPAKLAVNGTLLALEQTLQKGWAINLSGGFHHAKQNRGDGFCIFNDIAIAVYKYLDVNPSKKILIIDLDAHQGDGYKLIFDSNLRDGHIFVFDIFNSDKFPRNFSLRKDNIFFDFRVHDNICDQDYLRILRENLPRVLDRVNPDLVIYNAGYDVFEQDKLGGMKITLSGIIARDQFVFEQVLRRDHKIPILMVLSGVYFDNADEIVFSSVRNLYEHGFLRF